MSEYKQELYQLLEDLKPFMKDADIAKVNDSIKNATSMGQLQCIDLGLNFHKFRVENIK